MGVKELSEAQSAFEYQDNVLSSSVSPTGSRFMYSKASLAPRITSAYSNAGQRIHYSYNHSGDATRMQITEMPVYSSPAGEDGNLKCVLVNADGGRALYAYTLTSGYPVYSSDYYESRTAMRWELIPASSADSSIFVIRSVANTSLALTANSTSTAYTVTAYTAGSPTQAQLFKIVSNGDGSFRLLTAVSGYTKCVYEKSDTFHYTGSDNRVVRGLDSYNGETAAKWYLCGYDHEYSIVTSAQYSADGNYLASATDQRGYTTSYTYNDKGLVSTVTDPEGRVTSYSYDELGRTTHIQSPDAEVSVSYMYQRDLLSAVYLDDPDAVCYEFYYDAFGRRSRVELWGTDGHEVLASYSYTGRDLTSQSYANGHTVSFSYDSQGRTVSKLHSDTGKGASYTYDAEGNLWQTVDSQAGRKTTQEYDLIGRNVGTVLTNQNGSSLLASQSIRYTPGKDTVSSVTTKLYDQDVKRSVTYSYTYGEAAEGEIPDTLYGFTVDGRRVSFTYDPLARLSQRSFALSGTTKTQIYYYEISDDLNDTTFVSGFRDMLGNSYSFTYDKNGNITSDGSYYYCYDAIGQLVEVGDYVDYKEYVYDDRGNIRQKLIYNSDFDLVDTVVYGYGNSTWTDALTSYYGESFSYDAMGNPLNWTGGRSLTWSNGRNLASMGGVTFSYDADGLRTGKTSSSKSTAYYALNGKYVGEKTVINGTTYYISYYYDENGAPMGVNVNGSAYFFVKNLQGDITAIMSYTGTVVAKYTYDAWGKLLSVRDGNNQAVTSPTHIANLNPFRYRGYIYDTETGLYYLNSRYYDASVGRFLNADDVEVLEVETENNLQYNLYAYCWNNPINMADDSGNLPWFIGAAIGGAIFDTVAYLLESAFTGQEITWAGVGKAALAGAISGVAFGAIGKGVKAILYLTRIKK